MEVTVEIPEDIARQLHTKWDNLPRGVLESLALEAYRSGTLTKMQLRRLLGFQTPMELDGFLKQAGIYLDYDLSDLRADLETIRRVRGE
jgi:predicted HTH domain antitoxin